MQHRPYHPCRQYPPISGFTSAKSTALPNGSISPARDICSGSAPGNIPYYVSSAWVCQPPAAGLLSRSFIYTVSTCTIWMRRATCCRYLRPLTGSHRLHYSAILSFKPYQQPHVTPAFARRAFSFMEKKICRQNPKC